MTTRARCTDIFEEGFFFFFFNKFQLRRMDVRCLPRAEIRRRQQVLPTLPDGETCIRQPAAMQSSRTHPKSLATNRLCSTQARQRLQRKSATHAQMHRYPIRDVDMDPSPPFSPAGAAQMPWHTSPQPPARYVEVRPVGHVPTLAMVLSHTWRTPRVVACISWHGRRASLRAALESKQEADGEERPGKGIIERLGPPPARKGTVRSAGTRLGT